MIKKNLMLLIYFFTMLSVFCIDWKSELESNFISNKSVELGVVEAGNDYFRENNFLCIQYNLEMTIEKLGYKELESAEKIHAFCYRSKMNIFSDFQLREDGFLYGVIPNEPYSSFPVKEVPMIFGNEFSFAIPGMSGVYEVGSAEFKKGLYEDGTYEKKQRCKYPDTKLFNYPITKVNSSSHLVEKQHGIEFDYSGLNLDIFLLHPVGYWAHDLINPYCFPWVENAEDTGIGEWIEFELNYPQSITYILNGFVDGNRMHLYKANSRIKEAEIIGWTVEGHEIKQNVHFEDFVYFKTVQFSKPVKKFHIIIKEVYSGEKWQDTCISAVMFPVKDKKK